MLGLVFAAGQRTSKAFTGHFAGTVFLFFFPGYFYCFAAFGKQIAWQVARFGPRLFVPGSELKLDSYMATCSLMRKLSSVVSSFFVCKLHDIPSPAGPTPTRV